MSYRMQDKKLGGYHSNQVIIYYGHKYYWDKSIPHRTLTSRRDVGTYTVHQYISTSISELVVPWGLGLIIHIDNIYPLVATKGQRFRRTYIPPVIKDPFLRVNT